jgi:heterodisulfide reductase subunit B2
MKIGYFPGCSLEGTSKEYNQSLLALASAFDIELEEIDDWNCCGSSAIHNINHRLVNILPYRNLAIASKQGLKEIVIPCAACYNRFISTQYELNNDQKIADEIAFKLDSPFDRSLKILNVLDFIDQYIVPKFAEKNLTNLNIKVACYYGCLLARPAKLLNLTNPEDPMVMENILQILGANCIDWPFKVECCGAGLSVSKTDIVAKLSSNILDDANHRGAEALIVACPMCHSNLDMRRREINNHLKKQIDIPVLFITQALGLATGIDPKNLGLSNHFVNVTPLVDLIKERNSVKPVENIKQAL